MSLVAQVNATCQVEVYAGAGIVPSNKYSTGFASAAKQFHDVHLASSNSGLGLGQESFHLVAGYDLGVEGHTFSSTAAEKPMA